MVGPEGALADEAVAERASEPGDVLGRSIEAPGKRREPRISHYGDRRANDLFRLAHPANIGTDAPTL